jgi:hypothetical protein
MCRVECQFGVSPAGVAGRIVAFGGALLLLTAGCGDTGSDGEPAPADARPTDAEVGDATSQDARPLAPDEGAPDPDAAPPAGPFVLTVAGPDGRRPAGLRAFFSTAPEAEIVALACDRPGLSEAPGVRCVPDGLAFEARPVSLDLTVKAPGLHTLRTALAPTGDGGRVELVALPAFEATADYVTGFAPDAMPAALDALAFGSAGELGPTRVVKWYLEGLQSGTPRVWFQNTARHRIHSDFVRTVLGRPGTASDFEAATYHGTDRDAMAGSLVLYPELTLENGPTAPLTVELFPNDDATSQMLLTAYLALEERLPFTVRDGLRPELFAVPGGETQQRAVDAEARTWALAGARALAKRTLYAGIDAQYLNHGVAYGTLRLLTPEQLETAIVSFEDILLLPRLPNELPLVGGSITGELQTPLAHVNVIARARQTPNLALLNAAEDPRVAPFVGRLVRFEVGPGRFSLAETTLDEARAWWTSRTDRPPFTPTADLVPRGVLPLETLGFDDAPRIGVKAANVAELGRLLNGDVEHAAPGGFAVPFGEFQHFVETTPVPEGHCALAEEDCLEEGRTAGTCAAARGLCTPAETGAETIEAYARRLPTDPAFATDSATREAALDGLRWIMRHVDVDPDFAAALDAAVAARFGRAGVRLRSSTNAEDLDQFTGAGLYDSTTAYGSGSERASKEIRKIWASVWNWRAFQERAFWNVTHDAVKVGVLVHDAYPDEQVNGVLITQNLADPQIAGDYVNAQAGETSVTNPEDGAVPEIFTIVLGPTGRPQAVRQRFSSLSPDAALLSDDEIVALYRRARQVQRHFAPLYGADPATFALDLEWKLHGPERRLIIKQVRPYAAPPAP